MSENKKKHIILHSNYTVKKTHKKIDGNNTIYERDYTILNGVGPWVAGGIENGTPTFKMVRSSMPNTTKKHDFGTWLTQDACGGVESEVWTLDCLKDVKISNKENKIILKPNYNSLLNFVYYGSCSELIEKAVSHIIDIFPAELYFTDETFKTSDDGLYYVVDNPMNIDLLSKKNYSNSENLNKFLNSYSSYIVINDEEETTSYLIDSCNDTRYIERIECANDGDIISEITITYSNTPITIYTCKRNGNIAVLCNENYKGLRIRPKKEIIEKIFENLSDFEKVMLNTDTNPKYTMKLDFPHETENGVETYQKNFTWPTKYNWNLDTSSAKFKEYIDELMDLCDFYDERCTDNLWRIMTHESIKNMDNTIQKNSDDELDYQIGGTKLRKILSLYSRLFDDLKRYIDNIKHVNNVSYDSNNNVPDYFLSDKLELAGWEVVSTSPSINDNIKIGELYRGFIKEYSSTDANIEFMKRLLLNSKAILAHKGTKHGIEMLLSLFGLTSQNMSTNPDYSINEYVSVVTNGVEPPVLETDKLNIERYNRWKNDYITVGEGEYDSEDTLQGLPVRMVTFTKYDEDGVERVYKYVIPWFDRLQEIDGNPYFQMYGGWCKIPKRTIKNPYAPNVKNITTNNIDSIYEETIKKIRVVRNISDLTKLPQSVLIKNTIFYVYDIDDFDSVAASDEITLNGDNGTKHASNYFMITNPENYFILNGEKSGWVNIPMEDIENGNGDGGFKVLYLDSIVEDSKGNNPHGGTYDDGREYIEYFKHLFKYTIANNGFNDIAFNCETGEISEDILNCGFTLSDYVVDNVKTWYFSDTHAINDMYLIEKNERGVYETVKDSNGNDSHNGYAGVGRDNTSTFFSSEVEPFNFEGGEKYDEAAANSIITIKKLTLDFAGLCTNHSGFYDYFIKSILPYLKQMIPSTTIVDIKIKNVISEQESKEAVLTIDNTEKNI